MKNVLLALINEKTLCRKLNKNKYNNKKQVNIQPLNGDFYKENSFKIKPKLQSMLMYFSAINIWLQYIFGAHALINNIKVLEKIWHHNITLNTLTSYSTKVINK